MIIERFRDNDMVPIYQRVRDGGPRSGCLIGGVQAFRLRLFQW